MHQLELGAETCSRVCSAAAHWEAGNGLGVLQILLNWIHRPTSYTTRKRVFCMYYYFNIQYCKTGPIKASSDDIRITAASSCLLFWCALAPSA